MNNKNNPSMFCKKNKTLFKKICTILCILLPTLLLLNPPAFAGEMRQDADFDVVDAYIEGEMAEWNLPGVALAIVRDGQIVYGQGYGDAGPDGRPMTTQTPLFIGSTSKSAGDQSGSG